MLKWGQFLFAFFYPSFFFLFEGFIFHSFIALFGWRIQPDSASHNSIFLSRKISPTTRQPASQQYFPLMRNQPAIQPASQPNKAERIQPVRPTDAYWLHCGPLSIRYMLSREQSSTSYHSGTKENLLQLRELALLPAGCIMRMRATSREKKNCPIYTHNYNKNPTFMLQL